MAMAQPLATARGATHGAWQKSDPGDGRRLRAPPNEPTAARKRSGRTVGCMVLVLGVGRCAFRPPRVVFVLGLVSCPPRVVFVLGLVSLINSLTSGKNIPRHGALSGCHSKSKTA